MSKVVTQDDLFSILRVYEERITRLEKALFTVPPVGPEGSSGPPGPSGPAGIPGAPGAPGADFVGYTHVQSVPSDTWDIAHNLGLFPGVTVVDTAASVITPDVSYPDANRVTLRFSGATSGRAFLT